MTLLIFYQPFLIGHLKQDPTTEFENTYDYRGSFTYSYTLLLNLLSC